VNPSEVATTVAATAAAIGVVVAAVQFWRNARVQQAQFVSNLIRDHFEREELRRFFYRVDYEEFEFSKEDLAGFKGSDDERLLDELLYKYNHVAQLVRLGVIALSDIEFIMFEMIQIFKNTAVIEYISWLDGEYAKHGGYGGSLRRRPFDNARWLLEQQRTQIGTA
jgi:hypothetical protein